MLFHAANLPYWIFLSLGVVLFCLVIFAGGGDEDLGSDVGGDINVEVGQLEVDTDMNMDADADAEFQLLQILSWIGIGKAPLMLLLAIDFSTWGVLGWMLNVILGNLTGSIPVKLFGLGGLIAFSSLVLSLLTGNLMARPIGRLFSSFGEDASSERLIGCTGTVASKKLPYLIAGRIGQVDITDPAGNLVTVSASLPEWATVVPHHGQEVLIIEQQKHSYIAIAKDTSDEDKWLAI